MKKQKNIRRIIVILFIVIIAIITYVNERGSYLEYKEIGENYISVYWTNMKFRYITIGISFILSFIIMYTQNRGIKKGLKVFFDEEKKDIPKLPNKSLSLIISVILSIITAALFTSKIILFASNVSFENADPIFNLDISFYMFIEPLIKMIILYVIGIFVFLIVYSTIYYIIVFNKFFDGINRETLAKSALIKHIIKYIRIISIFFAMYVLVRTLDIVFEVFITTENDLELVGAGVVNSTIKIWGNIILAIVIVISIFRSTKYFKDGNRAKIIKNLAIIPAYMVLMFLVMVGFDLIFVQSNEYDREKNHIEENISSTLEAYGIEYEEEVIEYSGTITSEDVQENQDIIDNAAIINKDIVLQNLEETQTETGYYTYTTASIAKININQRERLVYVSPREILNTMRTFNSKTYEYTHGYGLILTSASTTEEDGNVEYIQSDITGNDNILNIKTPQIYYGLETDSTVVTNANNQNEYDYTDNQGNEHTTSYTGDSGLTLNFLDRLIIGIRKGSPTIAFSSNVTENSKILINRNIIERAKTILPDVIYDEQPYTVVDENGDIYWVLDAYTVSSNYPYSTYITIETNGQRQKINYIRNSIKVIINAYNGDIKFYITDRTDPIAMAYRNMYKDLFQDIDAQIPESISKDFIYPKYLYDVQATILEEYHNTKSELLYRSDDSWEKATYNTNQTSNSNSTSILDAYYTMVQEDGEKKIGLIQMFTPVDKQNLTSYLVGTINNGTNKLKLYKLSSDTNILGPTQLDSKIAEDETIQDEIDSLSVSGARVTKDMIIIPINNTLLYIEPIYQTRRNESDAPLLKKVVIASGNKVSIGDTLEEAVNNILSEYATIDTYTTEDIEGIIQSIIKANKNLSESMNSNDWELMGTDIKRLQELISLLEEQVNTETQETNTTADENNNVVNTEIENQSTNISN